jgi:hypothetical protein
MRGTRWIAALGLLGLSGCSAGFYLVGGTTQQGAPPSSRASFRIAACAKPTGETVGSPDVTYHLGDDAFYEMEANGTGTRITNSWADDKGRYFFARVKLFNAWMYFVPNDPAQPALRHVYLKDQYTVSDEGGVLKPVGAPAVTCTLARI